MVEQSLIAKLEGTFASGSPEKQLEILRHVTDLFMIGAKGYSDEQIDLFDGVISRLADRIEIRARDRASQPAGAGRKCAADHHPPARR